MKSRVLLIVAVMALSGCRGCGEHAAPPPPSPVPPTATVAVATATPAEGEAEAEPTPADHAIIVFIEAEPDSGPAPLTVVFRADDPLKNIEDPTYKWDFGDGSPPSDQRKVTHVYEHPGTYSAHLLVTDGTGVTDDDNFEVEVKGPETPQAAQP